MRTLVTICARGGSKGIPGKNIRPLSGLPLIGYSIKHAQTFAKEFGADVALSTDDKDIKKAAASLGLHTEFDRPKELATDSAGKIPVIADLLRHEEKRQQTSYDLVLDLDVTSPMRTLEDLQAAKKLLANDPKALNLFSVNPARRHPSFNMVQLGPKGYAEYCVPPKAAVTSRQNAPKAYDMNASFYFYRREFFHKERLMAVTERSLVYVMPHACFDLDDPVDFLFLEFLMKENHLDFAL